MSTTIEQFNKWLKRLEDVNLEFKASTIDLRNDLPDYCAALTNEGGGKLILGVNNERNVVGTTAFSDTYNTLSHKLLQSLKIRIDVEELIHPKGRVLIFHIPKRPPGKPIRSTGNYKYPMRVGESLQEMDDMTYRKIINEIEAEFSSKIVQNLHIQNLDKQALTNLKKLWAKKSQRKDYLKLPNERMLRNIGLMTDKGLNYACLILLGEKRQIDELLPGSEIIFEWRQKVDKTAHDYRLNLREPFFIIYDKIWEVINNRNLRFPFQEGFVQREIWAFDEKSTREAVLNAVAHRDYSIQDRSIFIKASPEAFIIESPGGFPNGITLENFLYEKAWRNRTIAETFEKTGLVERSGQGLDDIFEKTIRDGKGLPDLTKSNDFTVRLEIPAQIKDQQFILFLEKIANEKQISLSFDEIFKLESIRKESKLQDNSIKKKFLELGIIEKVGKTKDTKYILSRKYYEYVGNLGVHTRLTGISRNQKKLLILNHLRDKRKGTSSEFQEALSLSQIEVNNLLQELKREGKVTHSGSRKLGYWLISE